MEMYFFSLIFDCHRDSKSCLKPKRLDRPDKPEGPEKWGGMDNEINVLRG